jgi:hypothetical protein
MNRSQRRFRYISSTTDRAEAAQGRDASIPESLLEAQFLPDCRGEPVNEQARLVRPLLHLILGRTCSYLPPVGANPFFRDLDMKAMKDAGHRLVIWTTHGN